MKNQSTQAHTLLQTGHLVKRREQASRGRPGSSPEGSLASRSALLLMAPSGRPMVRQDRARCRMGSTRCAAPSTTSGGPGRCGQNRTIAGCEKSLTRSNSTRSPLAQCNSRRSADERHHLPSVAPSLPNAHDRLFITPSHLRLSVQQLTNTSELQLPGY
jgi:hypothetical protein